MSDSSSGSGGVGFFGMLAIVFIALKLTGAINWSWWLVLLPLYGPPLVFVPIALAVIYFGVHREEALRKRRQSP